MALSKIPSAGFQDNVKFRNLIINGSMDIAQRGTSSTGVTSNGYYTCDRWNTIPINLGTWTLTKSTDVPTNQGFASSFKLDCTTADASPAADDLFIFRQKMEGQNLQYIKKGTSSAESLTLSFWVKSNKTGTYIAELFDNDNTRQISKAYTINSADTWEKKTVTFPGDTTGALDNDNAVSLLAQFWLGSGSTYSSGTLSTTWTANTNANRAVGQVNLADSTSNEWYITGVQLEAGTTASDFEFLPFDVNYQRCARYYATNGRIYGIWYSVDSMRFIYEFHTPMRTNPSLILINSSAYHEYWNLVGYTGLSAPNLVNSSKFAADFQITSSSNRGRAYGNPAMINHGTIAASAEL